MATRPARRYPIGRSETKVPCLEYPSPSTSATNTRSNDRRKSLILFIPGNPGLASYYVPFLKTLRLLLNETEKTTSVTFDIFSQNLIGFDDGDHVPAFGTTADSTSFSLEDQICWMWDTIERLTRNEAGDEDGEPRYDEVILMGHSVGAYIAMEIFHRHHLALQGRRYGMDGGSGPGHFDLKAGIMLFPTLWHIAKSPNGLKFDLLRRSALLDRNAHHVAKWVVGLFPRGMVQWFVRRVMGFSEEGAAATADFLVSRDGIWQSLHLAKDEMATITEEKWEREMWEMADEVESGEVDKFYFLFGKKDHWVADETRDEFIERRKGHVDGKVRIAVDEGGVPHAFCIHHSEVVAEKVKSWIDEIAGVR